MKKGPPKTTTEVAAQFVPTYKPPTPTQRLKDAAQSEKHNATRRWVAGEMSSTKHKAVHDRANHVIKNAKKYK